MRGLLRPAPTLTGTEGAELKDKYKQMCCMLPRQLTEKPDLVRQSVVSKK